MALAPTPIEESHTRPHLVVTPTAPVHAEPIHTADIAAPEIAAPEIAAPEIAAPEIVAQPITAPPDVDLPSLQSAMVAALAAVKGQQSASEQIEDSTLTLVGDTLEIQTNLSKMMLPLGINAEAEKLLLATLRAHNLGAAKLRLLPGAGTPATPKKPRKALSGSAAELAANHPIVQQAKQLFSAEISNIIDLRD
jgi:DNA polymerase-3 subunit gamma/tau